MKKINKHLDRLYRLPEEEIRNPTQEEVNEMMMKQWYDSLIVPPLTSYFTLEDVKQIHDIALSPALNNEPVKKYKLIGDIMQKRGFVFIGGGTNRRSYSCIHDPRVVAKVATDKVGISNNQRELVNQAVLKPFCCKIFEVSPCGTLAIIERVKPIKELEEFEEIAERVFDILLYKIRNKNIGMEDIGSRSFKNWGVRNGFGPVLLDYPTMYVVDPKKCFCNQVDMYGRMCNCSMDYDEGFDNILCTGCGHRYLSKSLAKKNGDDITELIYASGNKDVMKKGRINMKVSFTNNNGNVLTKQIGDGSSNHVDQTAFVGRTSVDTFGQTTPANPKVTKNTMKVQISKYIEPETTEEPENAEVTHNSQSYDAMYLFDTLSMITKLRTNEPPIFYNFVDNIASRLDSRYNVYNATEGNRRSVFYGFLKTMDNATEFFNSIINEAISLRNKIAAVDKSVDSTVESCCAGHNDALVYSIVNLSAVILTVNKCFESAMIGMATGKVNVNTVKSVFSKFNEVSYTLSDPCSDNEFVVIYNVSEYSKFCLINIKRTPASDSNYIETTIEPDNVSEAIDSNDNEPAMDNETNYSECDDFYEAVLKMMLEPTDEFKKYVSEHLDDTAQEMINNLIHMRDNVIDNFEKTYEEEDDDPKSVFEVEDKESESTTTGEPSEQSDDFPEEDDDDRTTSVICEGEDGHHIAELAAVTIKHLASDPAMNFPPSPDKMNRAQRRKNNNKHRRH